MIRSRLAASACTLLPMWWSPTPAWAADAPAPIAAGPVPAARPPAVVTPPPVTSGTMVQPSPPIKRDGLAHRRSRAPAPAIRDIASANRDATLEPGRQAFLDATLVYPFSDGAVFHVYTAPGLVTDIALQPGEILAAVASGDTVRWVIGDTVSGSGEGKRTHILVKPFSAGLATNLVITTDRRTYHLALSSTQRTATASLAWTYPQDALIALKKAAEAQAVAAPIAASLEVERLHFDYQLSGDNPTWRPLRAFDDGRQTFIEFPPSIATDTAPPLFLISAKGEAELVNYRVRGRYYIVDRLFDIAELRFGLKHQDVVRITRVASPLVRRAS